MNKRKLEELNVMDDFLFRSLMLRDEQGEEFCRILLKAILNKDFRKIRVTSQKDTTGPDIDHHGIRLDAYIEVCSYSEQSVSSFSDEDGNTETANVELLPDVYEIEPNTYRTDSEARRTRYYHALMDSRTLKTGFSYNRLQNAVIIMILPYDPFGKNRMVYTVKNCCLEDSSVEYEDGSRTIYLYTRGTEGNPGRNLQDMLKYLEQSTVENVKNEDIAALHHMVMEVKQDAKVGIAYMKAQERDYYLRQEGKIEGLQILINMVINKLRKNIPYTEISAQLEMDETLLRPIYDTACQFAPDYDLEKITKELLRKKLPLF